MVITPKVKGTLPATSYAVIDDKIGHDMIRNKVAAMKYIIYSLCLNLQKEFCSFFAVF